MIQTATQILMHFSEPFVHRYIMRGIFHDDDDKDSFHTMFVVLWFFVYAFFVSIADMTMMESFVLIIKGLGLRFVAQNLLLNILMIRDGHPGRRWHDLRDKGIDLAVQKLFRWTLSYFKQGRALRVSAEKLSIIFGTVLTIIIMCML